MLPALMILFAISWGLLTTLVVLQDRMIDAQRDLIHLIFKNVAHRAVTRTVAQTSHVRTGEKAPASGAAHARRQATVSTDSASSIPVPSAQTPSTQVPLSQNASSQTPSSQEKPQAGTKSNRNSRKAAKPLPAQPPAEITDPSDMRRVLISI